MDTINQARWFVEGIHFEIFLSSFVEKSFVFRFENILLVFNQSKKSFVTNELAHFIVKLLSITYGLFIEKRNLAKNSYFEK